ncbi:unnamed protein product [Larinioides sclopetarius]|uniref:Uncharacterized protein n=1 Tax=Larinioides sclopetarius TaxID=280406 RepID=A0AAV1ZT71_9ARAC
MDKNCLKRHLHEESNSASDGEGLLTPRKQPNIQRKSFESSTVNPSLIVASAPPAVYGALNSSSDAECLPEYQKQHYFPRKALEFENLDTLPKESATATTESDDTEIQKIDSGNAPTKTTRVSGFEISTATLKVDVDNETEEDSLKDSVAKALKMTYMNNYANKYSKELLFAVDVMTLVRHLNNLECRYIIYATSGNAPISPCNDTLDQALGIMWTSINNKFGHIFESQMINKGDSYWNFQNMILNMAEREENEEYDEKSFLKYCLILAQWAVCAESAGVSDAREFIPLVICRTIHSLKDSGKLPSNFWERIAEKALDIINEAEGL